MKTTLKLLIAPVLALLALWLGYSMGKHSFWLYRHGTHTEGRIVAMVKEDMRTGSAELYFDKHTTVRCATADGAELRALVDGSQLTGMIQVAHGVTSRLDAAAIAGLRDLSKKDLSQNPSAQNVVLLSDLLDANLQTMERRVEREMERSDGARPVRVVKEEHLHVIAAITGRVTAVAMDGAAVTSVVTTTGRFAGDASLRVIAAAGGHEEIPAHTGTAQHVCSFIRTLDGVVMSNANADFISFETSSFFTFWPVVSFRAGDVRVVKVTNVGRRLTVPPDYRLGARAVVAYNPGDPRDAQLIPDFAAIRRLSPLMRFNARIEAVFGLWLSPAILLIMGVIFSIAGLVLLSMVIWPGVTRRHLEV